MTGYVSGVRPSKHLKNKWLPTVDNLRNFVSDTNGRNAQFHETNCDQPEIVTFPGPVSGRVTIAPRMRAQSK